MQDQPVVGVLPVGLRHDLQPLLHLIDRLARRQTGTIATRKMWVSTANVPSPNAAFSTTFAVLRPTPGSACSSSRVRHLSGMAFDQRLATGRPRSSPWC